MLWFLTLIVAAHAQSYCTNVGPSSTADSELGPIKLRGKKYTIDETSGCPGQVGLEDFTETQKADLAFDKQYTLEFDLIHCGLNGFPFQAGAWIDYNQDFTWTEDERIMTVINTYGQGTAIFTVPSASNTTAIVAGVTRMRVQLQESARLPYNPCAMFGYGGTKDYQIIISAGGGGGGGGGLSGGGIFLIMLTVISFVYILGGCIFMRTQRGTQSMKESCPNNEFWFGLPGLVMDGIRFTKAKVCGCGKGGGGFDNMTDNDL